MANGLRIPCGATTARHSGAFAEFLCKFHSIDIARKRAERERVSCWGKVAVCVAPFCGTSKSAQLLPGKNAETARKRKSQWQQHRHRQLIQLPCTPSVRYDDISCADQRHTLTLTLQLPMDEPCLGQAKRSQNARREQPRASSQATCGTSKDERRRKKE